MIYIAMLNNTLKKQKYRNIFLIIELTIAIFIMYLVASFMEGKLSYLENKRSFVKSNTYSIDMYGVEAREDDKDRTGSFMAGAGPDGGLKPFTKDVIRYLEQNPKLMNIGKTYEQVTRAENDNSSNIKANKLHISCFFLDGTAKNLFNFSIIKGENLNKLFEHEAVSNNDIIPIWVDPDLADLNPLGSIVELPGYINGKTKLPQKYKVEGVLDPSKSLDFHNSSNRELNKRTNVVVIPELPMVLDYPEPLFQTVLVQFKQGVTKEEVVNDLNTKFSDSFFKIYDIEQWNVEEEEDSNKFFIFIFYSIILLILSAVGIISMTYFTLLKKGKEIGIRFAVGAKKSSVISLLVGEYMALFMISDLLALLLVLAISLSFDSFLINFYVVTEITGITMIFMFIATLPMFFKMLKLKPIELLREG